LEKAALANKIAENEELKKQIAVMNDTVNSATEFHGKMNVLHEAGLIKQQEDGSLIVVDDMNEREVLKE